MAGVPRLRRAKVCLSSIHIENVAESLTAALLNAEQHCPHLALAPHHSGFNLSTLSCTGRQNRKGKAAAERLEQSRVA